MDEEKFNEAREALAEMHEHKKSDPALERMAQEHVEDVLRPIREPRGHPKYKEPFQYYEPAEGTGGLPAIICTCGWSKHHLRLKVLGKASEKHFMKTGHNTKPKE